MSSALIHDMLTLALGMWLGGIIVTVMFGESAAKVAKSQSVFTVVLILIALTWPISAWFVAHPGQPGNDVDSKS